MIKTADRRAFAAMSALGQKQTCAVQHAMSALPLKADMCGATSTCPLSANSGHAQSPTALSLARQPSPIRVSRTATFRGVCGSAPITACKCLLSIRMGTLQRYCISVSSRNSGTNGESNRSSHQGILFTLIVGLPDRPTDGVDHLHAIRIPMSFHVKYRECF